MKKTLLSIVVAVVAFGMFSADVANASLKIPFDFSNKLNEVSFKNYELILRKVTSGGDITLGGTEYKIIDDPVGTLLAENDYLVAIYRADGLRIDGTDVDSPFAKQEFTAYGALQIDSASVSGSVTTIALKVPDVDPFGVLSSADLSDSRVLKLFYDDAKDFTHQSGTAGGLSLPTAADLVADVTSASNGSLFGAFGFGAASDAASGGVTSTATFWSSDFDTAKFGTSTRSSSKAFGSASAGVNIKEVFDPSVVFPGVYADNGELLSLAGTATLHRNIGATAGSGTPADYRNYKTNGDSNWAYYSRDPFSFRAVPEPGSVAIWIIGAAGTLLLGGVFRRRQD